MLTLVRIALAFAGTEPAALFVSHDGAKTWRECSEVAALRDNHEWYLPYSPEAGCVRGFAFHGTRGYAAVEVGGVLRSDDRGETWQLAASSTGNPWGSYARRNTVHPDVHSIEVHPSSPDLVFAPTGGGFYVSSDGGKRWHSLYRCYCRAVWLDANDANHLILGPANGVDRQGRIEESHDGGQTWHPIMTGLPRTWPRHMVERFTQASNHLLAVLSNGKLIAAPLASLEWQYILPDVRDVRAVTTMKG